MNEINIGEVYYIIAKRRSRNRADAFLQRLETLPITALSNTFDDVLNAARIKAVHALSYADAFAAASAEREEAALVTGDAEFHTVAHRIEIEWLR